jgi:GH25 family lysozyme M1 (1,4-beta-N-acetylmuramidase)
MQGIDVSHYNAPIDWELVKNQIDFAILKLGNIGDNNKFWLDNTFEQNYTECKRLGIPIGVYVYCYTNSPENSRIAGEQVRAYLSDKPLELPIYIDMEDEEIKIEGKDRLTEIVIAFNTEIEKANKWAGVYANLDWFRNYLHADILKEKYTCWIAHIDYTNQQDKYLGQYDMFQYSWVGKVNGCNGNKGKVDMNIMYRDMISEIAGDTPSPTPQKSNEEIADEVIQGLWGNKDSVPSRQEQLENAGYNYNEIQAIVNQKLGFGNYYPACDSGYNSIVDALNSIGVDSSYANRKNIAIKNGINNYTGTATQNNQLLAKLKAGRLKK